MTNQDEHGIRYSYFSFNELADWCGEVLFYGPQAKDLSYEEALEDLKAEAGAAYDNWADLADIAAAETDHGMSEQDREKFIEQWFEKSDIYADKDDFVQNYMDRNSENIQIDEPVIEGVLDGVSYRVSWLGGSPGGFILSSPYTSKFRLCSPCVPGACDLSSPDPEGFIGYDVPPHWKRDHGSIS